MKNETHFDRPSCRQPLSGACAKSDARKQLKVGHWVGGDKGVAEKWRKFRKG